MSFSDNEVEKLITELYSTAQSRARQQILESIRSQIIICLNDNYEEKEFCEGLKAALEIIDGEESK